MLNSFNPHGIRWEMFVPPIVLVALMSINCGPSLGTVLLRMGPQDNIEAFFKGLVNTG